MNDLRSELAVNGGKPVCEKPLSAEPWPPLYDITAERLKDIYMSREWSFNSPAEQDFQKRFAEYHDAEYGIFMANGTVTLQAALSACGVKPGDEVIVPANTWMATAMAVHYVGAVPVLVDVEPTTLCIDPEKAEEAITEKTSAIIPVHLFGSMADMDAVIDLAERKGLFVIEDCAHMHGGKWKGKGVGSLGHVGSFSLQQSKTLTCGEGGICLTNDSELAERIFRIKHIGYDEGSLQGAAGSGPPEGLVCHNFRGTAFQAVILDQQLELLKQRIDTYNKNAKRLTARVEEEAEGVRVQSRGIHADPQGYYGIVFIFDEPPLNKVGRKQITEAAAAEGLTLGGTYGPVYDHVLFNLTEPQYRVHGGRCPVSENEGGDRALSLSHPWLGADDGTVEKIGDIICKVARCLATDD